MFDTYIFRSVSKGGRQRVHKVIGSSFEIAKEKAIEKFSHIIHFKQKTMDLQTARKRAAEASQKTGKSYYIIYDEDMECSVGTAPLKGVQHKFVDGKEDKNFHVHDHEKITAPAIKKKEATIKTAKESADEDSTKLINVKIKNQMSTKKSTKSNGKVKSNGKKAAKKKEGSGNGTNPGLYSPVVGGAAAKIQEALKKAGKKGLSKAALAKAGDTKEGNVAWYIQKLRNNEFKVTVEGGLYINK